VGELDCFDSVVVGGWLGRGYISKFPWVFLMKKLKGQGHDRNSMRRCGALWSNFTRNTLSLHYWVRSVVGISPSTNYAVRRAIDFEFRLQAEFRDPSNITRRVKILIMLGAIPTRYDT
jgi:hypothetical protein